MSQENINVVKNFYKPAAAGDFEAIRRFLAPNVEWIEPNVPGLPFGGTHRGLDAVINEVIRPTLEKFAGFGLQLDQFFDVGDHVITIGRFYARGKTTGKELNAPTAQVLTLQNGKIVRFEAFHDLTTWLQALGLEQRQATLAAV